MDRQTDRPTARTSLYVGLAQARPNNNNVGCLLLLGHQYATNMCQLSIDNIDANIIEGESRLHAHTRDK